MRPMRIAAVVAAAFAVLIGFGLTAAGGVLTWVGETQRDADGFVTSPQATFNSDAFVIVVDTVDLPEPVGPDDWTAFPGLLTVRVRVSSPDGGPLFLGLAPAERVRAYLRDVPHDVIEELDVTPFHVAAREVGGSSAPTPPSAQDFWVARSQGYGTRALTWDARPGSWALVVMNADGAAGVDVVADVALRSGALMPMAIGLLAGGGLLLLVGVITLVAGLLGGGGDPAAAATGPPPGQGAVAAGVNGGPDSAPRPSRYPLSLSGALDPALSRGLWLVKWAAALPHAIVLMFLWVAFGVTTVLAGVAVLFTGRYPRGLFDFNVGVMRWTWRVAFYTYGAGATDRYPPFTLAPGGYPADLHVAYPERLSRGLVLVKWLLAFPHLVIAGVFAGGGFMFMWPDRGGDGPFDGPMWGGGVIGVLVLVALVTLLFSRAYPRQLFDLVMGLNRWIYRVWAYVGLMTDEYPPFRLDQGPEEPSVGTDAEAGPPRPPTEQLSTV